MSSRAGYLFQRGDPAAAALLGAERQRAQQSAHTYVTTTDLLRTFVNDARSLLVSLCQTEDAQIAIDRLSDELSSHDSCDSFAPGSSIRFSDECKRAIAYACENAERSWHAAFSAEQLLAGLAKEPRVGALLRTCGIAVARE
jgi:ATP-dependent Clp protease ATP-binding subunit ClpA